MIATPGAINTLIELRKRGIICVLLSTSPLSPTDALRSRRKVAHITGLTEFLDMICVAPDYAAGKGEVITRTLEQQGIDKKYALMVGDTYTYDFLSAKNVGVDSVLIKTPYQQQYLPYIDSSLQINELDELLEYSSI